MSDTEVAQDVEWSDPPPVVRKPRKSKYDPVINALKERPGTWAKVMSNVNTASARILTQRGCKITTRTTGEGERVDVWAMYPGEHGEHDTGDMPDMDEKPKTRKPSTAAPKKTAAKKTPVKKTASRPRAKKR